MDNASFHRKKQLYYLAQKQECTVVFLPPYSPELNPIEHFWAWLKRTLSKIIPILDSFDHLSLLKSPFFCLSVFKWFY